PPQVADSLVQSLVGRRIAPDFHLFHGIPPYWAAQAFPLRNVIAMTVWETNQMPTQWRPALNHALEVWLPCDFNLRAFERHLTKPLFKLPHVLWPDPATDKLPVEFPGASALSRADLVFYAIFDWQDRKGPREMITGYFRAFPDHART